MIENITTNTSQVHVQSSTSQIPLDFDSILQELKSVGEVHQSATTMIVKNLAGNMKEDDNNTGNDQNRKEGSRVINHALWNFFNKEIHR